jgi:hypothetical protein
MEKNNTNCLAERGKCVETTIHPAMSDNGTVRLFTADSERESIVLVCPTTLITA